MSVYAYNNADAEAASGDLTSVMSQIEATLSEMDSDIRKLGASWEGSEQQEYAQVHGKWSAAADNLKGILGQIRSALDDNSQSVAETRNKVTTTIAGS